MKITRIEATSHRVPAKVPLMHEPIIREIVVVRVETDSGVTGYGLTGPIQRFAARQGYRAGASAHRARNAKKEPMA